MNQKIVGIRLLTVLTLFVFLSPSVYLFSKHLSVYDERRALLVILLTFFSINQFYKKSESNHPILKLTLFFVFILFITGFYINKYALNYALLEFGILLAVFSSCTYIGRYNFSQSWLRKNFLLVISGSAVLYGITSLTYWLIGWFINNQQPPWPELLHNFINRRFLNDWQTWLLPFLPAVLFAQVYLCRPVFHRGLSIAYFALLWALLLYSVGRATLYSQLASLLLIPLLFGRYGLRWSAAQIITASLGLIILIFAFNMNPFIESGLPTDRLTSLHSSGRLELWTLCLKLIKENPIFGIGPMQFAALPEARFTHPHNFLLQFTVEWGIPAAILFFSTLAWAFWRWVIFARERINNPECPQWEIFLLMSLTASMAAAAANSLLAGTAHTPMSMMMLILVVGCAYGLYRQHYPLNPHKWQRLSKVWATLTLVAGLWLGGFTTYELIHYIKNDLTGTNYVGGTWSPRYWRTGKLIVPAGEIKTDVLQQIADQ